jgi:hypothetical protein
LLVGLLRSLRAGIRILEIQRENRLRM